MHSLPFEIRDIIFSLLDYRSFFSLRITCKTYCNDIKYRESWNNFLIKTGNLETLKEVALFYDDDILLKQILNNLSNGETLSLQSHLIVGPCKKCISLFHDKNFADKLLCTESFLRHILQIAMDKGNCDLFSLWVFRLARVNPSKKQFCSFIKKSSRHSKFLEILLKTKEFDCFWMLSYDFWNWGCLTPLDFFFKLNSDKHVKLMLSYKKELCQNPIKKLKLCNDNMFKVFFNCYCLDTSKFAATDFSKIISSLSIENTELVLRHYPEIINIMGSQWLFSKIVENIFENTAVTLSSIKTLFQTCDAKDLIQKSNTKLIEKLVYCICHNNDKEFMKQLIDENVFKCVTCWHPDSIYIYNNVYRMFIMHVLNL
jgi:hypothetical protein